MARRFKQETYMVQEGRGCGRYILWGIIILVIILVVM